MTGSIDEKVRHSVTKLANLHFVSTRLAGERVKKLGEDPASVHITGCPSIDIAAEVAARPEMDFDPFEKYGGVGPTEMRAMFIILNTAMYFFPPQPISLLGLEMTYPNWLSLTWSSFALATFARSTFNHVFPAGIAAWRSGDFM